MTLIQIEAIIIFVIAIIAGSLQFHHHFRTVCDMKEIQRNLDYVHALIVSGSIGAMPEFDPLSGEKARDDIRDARMRLYREKFLETLGK